MGNCGEQKSETPLPTMLQEEYAKLGLPEIGPEDVSSELEREIVIAINMIRHVPQRTAKLINPKIGECPLLTKEGKAALKAV